MIRNNTRFSIVLEKRGEKFIWLILDGEQEISHSASWNGAVKAAQAIERGEMYPLTAPPPGSIRRVYWAASKGEQRKVIERIKSWFVGSVERFKRQTI